MRVDKRGSPLLACLHGGSPVQRVARFLLWGGLAVLIISFTSCGVGCVAGLGTVAGDPDAEEVMTGALTFGVFGSAISIGMLIVGSVLKAISPKPRE